MRGRIASLPMRCRYRSSSGWTATAVSPSMVSGRVVATTEAAGAVGEGVGDLPEVPRRPLLDLHLEVREGRAARGAPVDQVLAAVDQPLLVEGDEHLAHRAREPVVEGEPRARPVARAAEPFQLVARISPPCFSFQRQTSSRNFSRPRSWRREAALAEVPLDDHLRRDPRVVGAGQPQRVAPLHAPPADQDVLEGVVEGVAEVEFAGDVRRRDHDRVGLRARFPLPLRGKGRDRARTGTSGTRSSPGCTPCRGRSALAPSAEI